MDIFVHILSSRKVMVNMDNNTVLEELENVICEKLKDIGVCINKLSCLECMSNYGFKIFKTNQKVINENEPDRARFTTICPKCMSANVDDKVDYDYGFDEEVTGENHYIECINCGFNNR